MRIRILHFDTLDSTNLEALRHARLGAEEGLCVVALQQTAGRGRRGRDWVSLAGNGLYLSILLRPALDDQTLPLITLMAAVAVHDVLSASVGLKPDIKWPNDILVNEKKICGILAESSETEYGLAVVVGIGINLRSPADEAAMPSATSIESEGGKSDGDDVLSAVTRSFASYYDVLQTPSGPKTILEEWRRRSTYFSGKEVKAEIENNKIITGVTDGLEANGALRVRAADGEIHAVHAGDVASLRLSET